MIRSMTGYGRAESMLGGKKIVAEIKSVNHRNAEIVTRFPGFMASLEVEAKKLVSGKISRGRVEITVRVDSDQCGPVSEKIEINMPLIRNYYETLREIKKELKLKDGITLEMIAALKGGISTVESYLDVEEAKHALMVIMEEALQGLQQMREREGELLRADVEMRLGLIRRHMETVEAKAPEVPVCWRDKLAERLRDLTGGTGLDDMRLMQEVALMADKCDITEEIVRFASHLTQFGELLDGDDAAGRKMDFLLQEMHREINTVGYKCADLAVARSVIEIKTELAKLREQAQNIE
jgi:uncharacterized protein (TIGR00255 family)